MTNRSCLCEYILNGYCNKRLPFRSSRCLPGLPGSRRGTRTRDAPLGQNLRAMSFSFSPSCAFPDWSFSGWPYCNVCHERLHFVAGTITLSPTNKAPHRGSLQEELDLPGTLLVLRWWEGG